MVDRDGLWNTGILACWLALVLLALSTPTTSAALPDGRHYELVTPSAKNAADVVADPSLVRAASDGSAIQFVSLIGFADVRGIPISSDYMAIRGEDGGWRTHATTPPQEALSFNPDGLNLWQPHYQGEFSSDLSHGIFLAKTPLTDAPNVAHAINLYLRSDLRTPGAGSYQLLTDADSDQGVMYDARNRPEVADASADFSHVIFESKRNLVSEAASLALDEPKLYEWVNGSLKLVGMIPTAPSVECGQGTSACLPTVSQAGQGSLLKMYTNETISSDGQRVLFTVPESQDARDGNLYVRDDQGTPEENDDVTIQINASEPGVSGTPQPATFWTATSDGTKIYLTTAQKLTEDDVNSSNDLYLYDLTLPDHRLTRISVDSEPSDNQDGDVANGHHVVGAIGASQDGSTAYFTVTGGQLVAGGSTVPPIGNGTAGNVRIYRWSEGTLHEVGGINNDSELDGILGTPGWRPAAGAKLSRVSTDGQYLAFLTQGTDQLLSLYGKPERNHGDSCAPFGVLTACLNAYIYDAAANNGAGDLQCASCNPTGNPPSSNALMHLRFSASATQSTAHLSHALTDNGLLFFDSAEQLASEDENATFDTYEFNAATGQVYLLSSGRGKSRQVFLDATPDGRSVFIYSRTQLRSEDHDQSADIYNARVNGIADLGPPIAHSCEEVSEEGCRPASTPAARASKPASEFFRGPGDVLSPSDLLAVFYISPLTPRQRHRLATRGSARLTVSASAGGTIAVRVRARIGMHNRTLQVIHRRLKHASEIHPRIRLSAGARKQLAAQGRLRLVITTRYSQSPTAQRLRVTLGAP